MQTRFLRDVVLDDLLHVLFVGDRHMERANATAALHKGEDRALVLRTA